MKRRIAVLACAGMIAGVTAALAEPIEADIIGAEGTSIGTATLHDAPTGVLIRIEIGKNGLEPGWHGMHLHSVGDCSDIGIFKLSKGHINFDGREHGLLNENGPDNADLPNLHAHEDGSANAELFTTLVTVSGERCLLDEDGSALVIHANPDDHMSQSIGGAGGRVACGVIGG